MPGHDQLFKDLLQAFLADLLTLAVPALAGRLDGGGARFLEQEHFTDLPTGARRQLDLVAEVRHATAGKVLVHVEAEAAARSSMAARLWRYAMQLRLRHRRPVVSIVVFRRGGPAGAAAQELREDLDGEDLVRFRYFALGLAGADAETFLERPEPLAWALAALMRRRRFTRARLKLACLRRIARAPVDEARRFLLANFVETYLQLHGGDAAEYAALLGEETDREVRAMALTWAEKLERKGERRGEREGRKAGLLEGLEEGRQEGMRRLLLRQMELRFGPLSSEVRRRVEAVESAEELEELAGRVLTAESPAAMGL